MCLMKKGIITLCGSLLLFILPTKIGGFYNPLETVNNRFGIHVADTSDLSSVSALVNSSGGDWGYVTVVIQENDQNLKKWQLAFDQMRKLHLIPLVRIASSTERGVWKKLEEESIKNWISFLNSLNWVVENKYVIVGNEPNHTKEWGGQVSAKEYSDFLVEFSKSAKEASDDFFILPAGLDASAPNGYSTMDEKRFIKEMLFYNPEVFSHVDGWTSHSYPNPRFSGSPSDTGRGSIRTFEWELKLIKSLGVKKEFPIFITETGWAHNSNGTTKGLLETKEIGKNLKEAFSNAWSDKQIVAVTPFLLNYKERPFNIFSWTDLSGNRYSFFDEMIAYPKTRGQPKQIASGEIVNLIYPITVERSKTFSMIADVVNTGQNIWQKDSVEIISDNCLNVFTNQNEQIKPGEKTSLFLKAKPATIGSNQECKLYINQNGEKISSDYSIKISVTLTPTGYIKETTKTNLFISIIRLIEKLSDILIRRA